MSLLALLAGKIALVTAFGAPLLTVPGLVTLVLAAVLLMKRNNIIARTRSLWSRYRVAIVLIMAGGFVGALFSGEHILPALVEYMAWFIMPLVFALAASVLFARCPDFIKRIVVGGCVVLVMLLAVVQISRVVRASHGTQTRVQVWETAVVVGADQPLTGIGYDQFPVRYVSRVADVINGAPNEWGVPNAYNTYLMFWLYGGILGIAGFLCLISLALRGGGSWVPFMLLSVLGLVASTYFTVPLSYLFWLTVAVGIGCSRQETQSV